MDLEAFFEKVRAVRPWGNWAARAYEIVLLVDETTIHPVMENLPASAVDEIWKRIKGYPHTEEEWEKLQYVRIVTYCGPGPWTEEQQQAAFGPHDYTPEEREQLKRQTVLFRKYFAEHVWEYRQGREVDRSDRRWRNLADRCKS
ncbi:hypothetical protein [Limnoglobus roseus]|uniref:hypothetical protein n=1 Tax=Limnoglobus roseus TaxID=2598579 RepID=UPI0011EB49C5|nr:hypothetical protein [Limnoglobus roseus]